MQIISGNPANETERPMMPDKTELERLLKEAAKRPITEEELRQQRRSYVASEMAWGSDADEAAYRAALESGDKETLARLDAEAEQRKRRALRWFDRHTL